MTVRGIWAGAVALTFALAAPGWGEQPPPAGTQVAQQERGDLSVRVGVPDPSGNQAIFGLPLDAKGIQPVWVEIENRGDQDVIYAPIATDPDYYSPYEVSWRFHDALRPKPMPRATPCSRRAGSRSWCRREAGSRAMSSPIARLA